MPSTRKKPHHVRDFLPKPIQNILRRSRSGNSEPSSGNKCPKSTQSLPQSQESELPSTISLIPNLSDLAQTVGAKSPILFGDEVSVQHYEMPATSSTAGNPSSASLAIDKEGRRGVGAVAWEAVKETMRTIVEVSDVFPPLKSAVKGALIVIERFEAVKGNQKEFLEFAEKLKSLSDLLQSCGNSVPPKSRDGLDGLARIFTEKQGILQGKLDRALVTRVIDAGFDSKFIAQELRSLAFAIDVVTLDINIRTNIAATKVYNRLITDKLGHVIGSEFNRENRQGCMEGTRIVLLADILTWASDIDSQHVFWLNGMAGTGKTTVTETFCRILHVKGLLGASFFCSRHKGRSSISDIFPSLARGLAYTYPSFKESLINILEHCSDPLGLNLEDQYTTLILDPAQIAFKNTSDNIILSVDALDECEDRDATKTFLEVILKYKPSVLLKFFLTSRPEIAFRQVFTPANPHVTIRLHDIEDHIVEADIAIYLNNRLRDIEELWKECADHWPPPEIMKVVKRAGKLFIYASTAYLFISSTKGDPLKRLRQLASSDGSPRLVTESIDEIYTIILLEAFNGVDENEASDIKATLSTVVCAREPLSVSVCAKLMGIKQSDIRRALVSLHAVIRVPEGDRDNENILLYHASFPDYLTDKTRSQSRIWFIDIAPEQLAFTNCCFTIMNAELHFNITNSTTSYKSNINQPKPLRKPPHLVYACTAWGDHVFLSADQNGRLPELLLSSIDFFLRGKFLYWLEILSAIDKVQYASIVLHRLSQKLPENHRLKALSREFGDYIATFLDPIRYSIPHIYLSFLPFAPRTSMVHQAFSKYFPSTLIVDRSQADSIATQHQVLRLEHKDSVLSVAISPDTKYVISGSGDRTIRLWSLESGEAASTPLEGHTDRVTSVAFSPDGKCIVSGSDDCTIRLWNVETGEAAAKPLEGHTDRITSVAFSPDGKCIASGSRDGTIRIWSKETGKLVSGPFEDYLDSVSCVAYSPDGKYVSGSDDYAIQLWSVETGAAVSKPLLGNADYIKTIAFSPDGKFIVSGADNGEIILCSMETGETVLKPFRGHTKFINSIAFSPDGKYIVSGSDDRTIRLWSVESGKAVSKPLSGHADDITSVLFSLDGKFIVSGSLDRTLRLWNVEIDDAASESKSFSKGHTDRVSSVAFSPDSQYIVSGSYDNTVRVWSIETGEAISKPFEGHTDRASAVSFSPDGKYIASCSADMTILIWSIETGNAMCRPLEAESNKWAGCIAFSPDGKYIVSISDDGTIPVWSIDTGEVIWKPFERHSQPVRSVAFSPDGKYIVSCSEDQTVRLWCVETCEGVLKPLKGHTDEVLSVAFSPDGKYIASGSVDCTIRLWSTETGAAVCKPFEGHDHWVVSITFSPDGKYIASGSGDHTVRLWCIGTGKEVCEPFQGHTAWVASVAFSPDGKYIASGSHDSAIRLWSVEDIIVSKPLEERTDFSPDGIRHVADDSTEPEKNEFFHDHDRQSLDLDDSGWVTGTSDELMFWVPPHVLTGLYRPGCPIIFGVDSVKVDLRRFVHGENWVKCYSA